jgi:hypothetical protein
MQSWRLDNLISNQLDNNPKLTESLKLIQSRPSTGSLAAYDGFEFEELHRFLDICNLNTNNTITGSESFPGEMLPPNKSEVMLPHDIYKLLVDYYNVAYEMKFVSVAGFVESETFKMRSDSDRPIVVLPDVDQFGRLRIGAKIFGSTLAPRFCRNAYILAKFVQENGIVETFPGQVQFYFDHNINLSDGSGTKTHHLAFVKWFLPVSNQQTRFNCRIGNDDRSCNIELWKKDFYEVSRDSIIPVHNIYCRFIPCDFTVGVRKPVKYMAVIPVSKHFNI